MDKVLLFVGGTVFGLVDKLVEKWLRFRNLVSVQRMHSNERGAYKWHFQNYRWYDGRQYHR